MTMTGRPSTRSIVTAARSYSVPSPTALLSVVGTDPVTCALAVAAFDTIQRRAMGHFAGRRNRSTGRRASHSGRSRGSSRRRRGHTERPQRRATPRRGRRSPRLGEHPGSRLYLPGGVEHDGRHGAGRVVVDAVAEHDIEPRPSLPCGHTEHGTPSGVRRGRGY